jgi:hypothetical protein
MAQGSQSAMGILTDDPALDLLSSSSALLASCPEPAAAALTDGDLAALTQTRVRVCAGAFARVAADVLLSRQAAAHRLNDAVGTPEATEGALSARALWRLTVLDLAQAMRDAQVAREAVQTDAGYLAVDPILRQLTNTAERLAAGLEISEPTAEEVAEQAPSTIALPDGEVRTVVRPQRRRPWFGAEADTRL